MSDEKGLLSRFTNLAKHPATIIVASILLATFLITVGFIRYKPDIPEQRAHFELEPLVIVCRDSQYDEDQVEQALAFWETIGYSFHDVLYDFDCGDGLIYGAITIGLPDQEFNMDKLGSTRLLYDTETKQIDLARIQVLDPRPRVLEHEIGHALGWMHVNNIGHMMHPDWSSGGWDNSGLEFKEKE